MVLKKKKKFLLLVSLLSISIPSIATIACESKEERIIYTNDANIGNVYSDRYYRPFQFNEIKKFGKGQPIMNDGLGYTSYGHGMSFIINIMRKLGFNIYQNEAQFINGKDGKISGINYHNKWEKREGKWIQETKKIIENKKEVSKIVKWKLKDFENNKENPEVIFKILEILKKVSNEYYESGDKHKLRSTGYRFQLDPLGIDAHVGRWTIWRAGQGNQNWPYRTFWVDEEHKQGKKIFDIRKIETGKKDWWNYTGALPHIYKVVPKGTKLRYTYSMPHYYFIIDGEKSKPDEASIEEGNRTILITKVKNYQELEHNLKTKWIGGKVIKDKVKINSKWSFKISFRSYKNLLQGFQIIKEKEKIEEIKMLMTAVIKNLHYFLNKNNFLFSINPNIKKLLQFIKNLKMNEKTLQKIHNAVEELNNGTHNMFAVEVFARGVENVPSRYMPCGIINAIGFNGIFGMDGMKSYSKLKKDKKALGLLIGAANTLDTSKLISWMHSTKKGLFDEKGEKSIKDNEGFDPENWDKLPLKREIIEKIKRLGIELPIMGGIVKKTEYKKWADKYNNWVKENENDASGEPTFKKYLSKKYLF